jgi:hypothetical protein
MSLWSSSANINPVVNKLDIPKKIAKKVQMFLKVFSNFFMFSNVIYIHQHSSSCPCTITLCAMNLSTSPFLGNSLGQCSLGNGNAASLGFTTLYLRASPPQNCKLLYFRIEYCLMITLPTHKRHTSPFTHSKTHLCLYIWMSNSHSPIP